MDYETTQTISEIRKRLNAVESRLAKLEPKPKPKPTIPSLEKTRKPTPQERREERAKLQQEAAEVERAAAEKRAEEHAKYGLHGSEAAGRALREKRQAPPVPLRPTNLRPRSSHGG